MRGIQLELDDGPSVERNEIDSKSIGCYSWASLQVGLLYTPTEGSLGQ